MTLDIPAFIFISVVLIGFGYVAGNAKSFNIWKLLLLGLFLLAFISGFNLSKPHLFTMLGAFLGGYFLPYAHFLNFIGNGLSDLINAVRYKSAYEDIRRKEAEVEELRKKYEQARKTENQQKQKQEYERRKQQSKDYRNQQKQEQSKSSEQGKSNKSSSSNRQHSSGSTKNRYLEILNLDPHQTYKYQDIKKAYRRQAAKYHPDKHYTKGEEVVQEMNEKFKGIKEAYEWLALNADK